MNGCDQLPQSMHCKVVTVVPSSKRSPSSQAYVTLVEYGYTPPYVAAPKPTIVTLGPIGGAEQITTVCK